MFDPGKPLKRCLMFADKAGTSLSETPLKCSTLGSAPGLTQNIRLGWKGLKENTLTYIIEIKSFTTLGKVVNVIIYRVSVS